MSNQENFKELFERVTKVEERLDFLEYNPPISPTLPHKIVGASSTTPTWSNHEPVPGEGKWHIHPNSEKVLIDRQGFTHMKHDLTAEQLAEAQADMGPDVAVTEGDGKEN